MKKLLLIILIGILTVTGSDAFPSKVKFTANGNRKMRVFLDNQLLNRRPTNFVFLEQLRPGRHVVRVEVYGRRGKITLQDVIFVRRGFESHFTLTRHGRNIRLVKAGMRPLGYDHYPVYDHYPRPARQPLLSDAEFEQLQNQLGRARFDGEKISIIQHSLRFRRLYSEDVLHLMDHLVYESSRLKLAKYAYHKVPDQQNYLVVSGGLRFASSRRELDRYLYQFPM
jgi:hypothetical protein